VTKHPFLLRKLLFSPLNYQDNMGLGEKAAALTLSERAIAANPIEKDAVTGLIPIEILREWRRIWGA